MEPVAASLKLKTLNDNPYYKVNTIRTKEEEGAEYPIRFIVGLGEYTALPNKVQYGVDRVAARGVVMKAVKFREHCEKFKEVGK